MKIPGVLCLPLKVNKGWKTVFSGMWTEAHIQIFSLQEIKLDSELLFFHLYHDGINKSMVSISFLFF